MGTKDIVILTIFFVTVPLYVTIQDPEWVNYRLEKGIAWAKNKKKNIVAIFLLLFIVLAKKIQHRGLHNAIQTLFFILFFPIFLTFYLFQFAYNIIIK